MQLEVKWSPWLALGRAEFNMCLHRLASDTGILWLELETAHRI